MNAPKIHAPKAIGPAYEMLDDFFKSRIAEGTVFKIDQTVQCSWMWFKLGVDNAGELTVLAPQAEVMPMRFVPDCSDALNLILTQRYICDSFGVACDWCNAVQSAPVIRDLRDCKTVFMNRTDRENGRSSGWFFGASDSKLDVNNPNNLELKSLWEISCLLPQTRDFFLLPQGWQVVFEDRPVVLNDFKAACAQPDSYYAARYQR